MEITILPVWETATADKAVRIYEHMLAFGKTTHVQTEHGDYLVLGVKKESITLEDIRFLGGVARRSVTAEHVSLDLQRLVGQWTETAESDAVIAFLEGWHLAGYEFLSYKNQEKMPEPKLSINQPDFESYAITAEKRVAAVNVARDLCNEPANKLTPAVYAERLQELFSGTAVKVEVIEASQLREKGFEATAVVGRGSIYEPRVVVLTLNNADSKPVVLVGKGVTFDSGGTNVKTGRDIAEMKMDMGGSAAVVGAVKLLVDLNLPVHVSAVIPMVTNVAGRDAFLPSDVIVYRNGKTVEVGNTDAEGRLILADGILYAEELGAETVIDIATLTGTIGQALGLKYAGIFSNDKSSLWSYEEIGAKTGDFVWPMPVIEEYQTYLDSTCADLNNMSTSIFGGAVTAAVFLQNFVAAGTKWIHIDMANTVRPWKEEGYYVPGASGFGVRLLSELVCRETGI